MTSSYDNSPGKIFIGGISPNTTQDTIQKYFEQFGELCDCVLMQDKATGKSRCFGFVTYKDANILDEVLSKKHMIDGKEIDCKRAIPRDQHSESGKEGAYKTKKLFVGGLTQTTTEEQFRDYFEKFGTIEDSVIMVDKETGKSRGFGFVTFDSEEAVDSVVERYNDNKIDGKWVECKRAQAKDVMSAGVKKGSKYGGGGGGGGREQGGGHQRHDRGGNSSRGYYQTSPTADRSGKRTSRNPSSQDYPDNYQYSRSGYSSNSGRSSNYDKAGPSGYNPYYDYPQGPMGYDPNSYNPRANPSGYNYNSEYASGYNANYPNSYPYMANNPYGAYPQQYGQQGYDPSAYGVPQGGQSASNPNVANPAVKGTEAPIGQMSANPNSQYPANAGYAPDANYGMAGYNYPSGDYTGGVAGGNAAYMAYGGMPGQGMDSRNMQGGKYPTNQVTSPTQGGSYPKSGQSDIGPIRGGNKKAGVEQRSYEPF